MGIGVTLCTLLCFSCSNSGGILCVFSRLFILDVLSWSFHFCRKHMGKEGDGCTEFYALFRSRVQVCACKGMRVEIVIPCVVIVQRV